MGYCPIQVWHWVMLKLDLAFSRHALVVDSLADNGLQSGW
jgi:hypothetical protein